jgi:hypothetical protein
MIKWIYGLKSGLGAARRFTSTGVVYGVADPAVTVASGARRVGVN